MDGICNFIYNCTTECVILHMNTEQKYDRVVLKICLAHRERERERER